MRIGIDCRTMLNPDGGERAGVGHYTTHLVDALVKRYKDEFVLFFDHQMPSSVVREYEQRKNVEVVRFPLSQYKRYLPVGYSHVFVAQVLRQQNLDMFHSPAYVVPMGYNRPSVVTVHDLAIYKHPSWFPPGQKFSQKVSVPTSIRKAKRVIAVSQATKKSITKLFNVPGKDIDVIYEGFTKGKRVTKAKQAEVREKFEVNDRFMLFVGTIEPRKNIVNLVKAFDHFMNENHERYRDLQLVIAGGKGWHHTAIYQAITHAKWSSNIRVVGYVSHEEKMALLASCLFFAFPSHWEGFGLPVLEAISMGVPVLTSRVSALPEVGGPGAEYVRPDSIRDIQRGMTALLRSKPKRDALARKGIEHAKEFSWSRCAQETHALYKEVVVADAKRSKKMKKQAAKKSGSTAKKKDSPSAHNKKSKK